MEFNFKTNKIKGWNGQVNDIFSVKIRKLHMRPIDFIGYIEIIFILSFLQKNFDDDGLASTYVDFRMWFSKPNAVARRLLFSSLVIAWSILIDLIF